MRTLPTLCCALVGLALALSAAAQAPLGGDPCDVMQWQTVNNGMGAEPGVVREFANRITFPAGCLRGGKTWVTQALVGVTRTSGSAADMPMRVGVREPAGLDEGPLVPGPFGAPPFDYTLEGVPMFPKQGIYELGVGPNANGNLNDGIYGSTVFLSFDADGDLTPNQFLVADQIGPTDSDCFTAIEGETPVELCTMGNPVLSAAGSGASAYTFYGRYTLTDESVQGREPLATTWGARYLNGGAFGGGTDLTVWRDAGDPLGDETICQFASIPDDFSFQCVMTASQLASLAAGKVFVRLTGDDPERNTRMIPADLFLFADGFESGDTSEWDTTVQ